MFIRNTKKLNKRGFTLAESVLALAVISLTSVATISLILSAQNATISAAQKQQAQLYAADIIACYRADGDLNTNIEFALGLEENSLPDTWEDNQTIIPLENNMQAKVELDGKTMTTTVTNDGKTLTTLTFTKGGTP